MAIVPSKEPTKVVQFFGYTKHFTSPPTRVSGSYFHVNINTISNHSSEKGFVILDASRKRHDYHTKLDQELIERKNPVV